MSHTSVIPDLDHKIQKAKENLFTGILTVSAEQDAEWSLYFLVGQIVWANTSLHSKRRWHRQFLKYSSDLKPRTLKEIAHQAQTYKMVAQLVMNQKFGREQFSKIVRGCISEILFDIVHQATLEPQASQPPLTYKVSSRNGANFPCIGLHREPIWEQVQQDWQDWQQANLLDYSPNLAPKIIQPELLRERTSPSTFRALQRLANGQQTLRDLAVRTKQPLIQLTQAMIPHIRRDLINLVPVGDLPLTLQPAASAPSTSAKPAPASASSVTVRPSVSAKPAPSSPAPSQRTTTRGPVVVYIDDSPNDSQAMAKIFEGSDYRYVNIANPLKALPKLIEIKPKLIFLDLVMPVVNGYELCAQIRRISALKETPVIIMTNNNGIPDRVRAKVVGANGFLSKPIKAKRVLKVVIKHLEPAPVKQPRPVYVPMLSPSV